MLNATKQLIYESRISFNKNICIDEKHEYTIGKYGPVIKCTEIGEVSFKNVKKDLDINKLRNGEYKLQDIIQHNETTSY